MKENHSKRRYYLNRKSQNNSFISSYNTENNKYKNLNVIENLDNNKYMEINSNISEIPKKLNLRNHRANIDNIKGYSLKQRNNTYIQQEKDNSLSHSQDIKKNNFKYFISPSPRIKEQKKTNINTGNLRYYDNLNEQSDYKKSIQNSSDYQGYKVGKTHNYFNEPKYKNKKITINNYDYNKIFTNQSYDLVSGSYNYKNYNKKEKKYPIIIVDKNKRYRFSTYTSYDDRKLIIKIQSIWRGYYLRKIAVGSIKKYIGFIALMKYLEKAIKNNKKDLFNEIINLLKKFTTDKNYKYRYKRIHKNNDLNSNNKKDNNEKNNNNNRRFRNFNSTKNESNNSEKALFKNVYHFNSVKFEPLRSSYNNKRNNENDNKRGIVIYFVDKEREKEKEREREKEQRKKDQIDREKENEKRRLEKEQRKKEQIEREKENEKRRLEKINAEKEKREREKQEKELKEKLERESKEKCEKELKEKCEKELKEKREKELKEKREKELKEKREKELKEKREKELREKREKDVKERFEKVRIEKEKDKGKEAQLKTIEKNINNKIINGNNNNVANDDDIFSKPIKIIYVPKRVSAFNNNKNSNKYYYKSIARVKKNKIERMIKYLYRKCYQKNFPVLLYQLKILRKLNMLKLKISSLNNIFKLILRKQLKKYLKNYREAVLNEKVKEEVLKKNMNLFKINKEKNTKDKTPQNKKNEIIYQNVDEITDIILEDNNENEDETNIINDNKNEIKEKIILRGKRKYLPKNNKLSLLSNIVGKKINLEKINHIELLDKHFKVWNKFINKYNDDLKPKIKINLHSPDIEIRGNKTKKKHVKVKFTKSMTSKTSIGSIKSEGKSNSSSIQTKKMRIKNVVVNPKEYITTTLLNNNPLYNNNANKANKKFIKLLYIMDKIDNKTMKYKCFKFWKKINNK